MVVDSHELALENVIKLIKSSEKNFKKGNFKDAIMEKLKAKSILKTFSSDTKMIMRFKEELSKVYSSKFDLIYDHKLRINESEKNKIVNLLEQKSEEKFKKGDFKGAIKALRRAEKYLKKI